MVPITRCHILYDAGELIVVDKPEGALSHPNPSGGAEGGAGKAKSAFEGKYDFNERSFATSQGPVWLIHRIDQDTSGVLIAARTRAMAQKMRTLFEEGQIQKQYITLVAGQVTPAKGKWYDTILIQKQKNKVRSRVLSTGKPNAKLRYEIERYYPRHRLTLLNIELVTGKTHQIRVQSAWRHHPIAGDEIYGNFPLNRNLRREIGLRRLFLHASAVELKHPLTGEILRIEAPMPLKLRSVIEALQGRSTLEREF